MALKRVLGIGLMEFQEKEEKQKQLEEAPEQIQILAEDNADMMFNQAMSDINIDILGEDNSELMFEIAMKDIEFEEIKEEIKELGAKVNG